MILTSFKERAIIEKLQVQPINFLSPALFEDWLTWSELPPLAEPLSVDSTIFDDIVQNAVVPILVDFWAGWCGPCRTAAPEVSRTAADMVGKAIVIKVDTESDPQLSARFQVRSIPNFVVLSGGRAVFSATGLVGHEEMEQWLRSASI